MANKYANHLTKLERLYETLDVVGKELMTELFAFRLLGFRKVRLSVNNDAYKASIEKARTLQIGEKCMPTNFNDWVLHKFDFNAIGYPARIFFTAKAVVTDFIVEQYAYKKSGTP